MKKYRNQSMEEITESFYHLIIRRNQEINDLYQLARKHNLNEELSNHQQIQKEKDKSDPDLEIFKKYRLDHLFDKSPAQLSNQYKQRKRNRVIKYLKTWEEFKSSSLLGKTGLIILYLFILANIIAYTIAFLFLIFRIFYSLK